MDKYQRKILDIKKNNWKKNFINNINKSKDIYAAVDKVNDEYIYYSEDMKEIKLRIKKILIRVEAQMTSMLITRTDLDKNKLEKIKKDLEYTRKKLKN